VGTNDQACEVAYRDKVTEFYLETEGRVRPEFPDRDRLFQQELARVLQIPDLPPVKFRYGLAGGPTMELTSPVANAPSLRITQAALGRNDHILLTLRVERGTQRDYTKETLLKQAGLQVTASWDGRAFALDRLSGRAELPGRILLEQKDPKVIEPVSGKFIVLVIASSALAERPGQSQVKLVLRYREQSREVTIDREQRSEEGRPVEFEREDGDDGKPIERYSYRLADKKDWIESDDPILLIPGS
jgi:hypothetical protein